MAKIKMRKSDELSPDEFVSTVARKAFPEIMGLDRNFSFMDVLREKDVLDRKEMEFLMDGESVPLALMAKVVLVAFEIFPYPVSSVYKIDSWKLYGEKEDAYQWTWDAAIRMGIVSADVSPDDSASKSQLRKAIQMLESHDYAYIPRRSFQGESILPKETTRKSWTWRNGILLGLERIPGIYLDMFLNEGWTIVYDAFTVAKNYSKYSSGSYAGLCNRKDKKIHITNPNPSVIVHEMGHFIVSTLALCDEQQSLFEEEGGAAFPFLRDYAKTNADEYLAVYWQSWIFNSSSRFLLEKAAPKTAEFVRTLLSC